MLFNTLQTTLAFAPAPEDLDDIDFRTPVIAFAPPALAGRRGKRTWRTLTLLDPSRRDARAHHGPRRGQVLPLGQRLVHRRPRLAGDELAVAFLRLHLAVVDRHMAPGQGKARQALDRVPSNTL
jgi:hypothetical protein